MKKSLLVGAAEVDITPPVGASMLGSLTPRPSEGIEDPLTVKAVVLESGGVRIAYAILDIAALPRATGEQVAALASERTGIPADHIVWACSHTHTGPVIDKNAYPDLTSDKDVSWLDYLPDRFARAVQQADASKRKVRMSRLRGYCHGVAANRRQRFKGGREINNWCLGRGEDVQCIGAAGPVDPEVGILCFDDENDVPIAVLWHYTCHANANFGPRFSADYPAVVSSRLRERYGTGVVSLFMPGFSGDVNPVVKHREIGDRMADVIIGEMEKRKDGVGDADIGAVKRDIVVPAREFRADEEKRRRESQWDPDSQEWFRQQEQMVREWGQKEIPTVIQAWRIGEVGFASFPGEPFIGWSVKIKSESPFPWTYPVELGGDYVGYLVTDQAYRAGGYESLYSSVARVSPEGVGMMADAALEMLGELWDARRTPAKP